MRHSRLLDLIGLAFILFVLADYLRPALLFLPTITAGGDTPCHFPTAAWFDTQLLPHGWLHGWYPGAYLGHPVLLYYFPLPFLLMSVVGKAVGLPVAFKLASVGGIVLLPLATFWSFRLMGFRSPGPLVGATGALLFLFLEENPIWGGTIASTLTGEFSYTYGIALAVLFFGVTYRAYADGKTPLAPAVALGITALAHGYAVLWAGLSVSYFLYGARKPLRTLLWLMAVGALAFALAAFFLVPLLGDWGWTTPYDDPWITVTWKNLLPSFLWPAFVAAGLGLAGSVVFRNHMGGVDRRLLFLAHAALVGAALATAGPALGIIDVRFVPFAQLGIVLTGAAAVALLVQQIARPHLLALALLIFTAIYGDASSQVLRFWVDWNYSGLQAKELWPEFQAMADAVKGTVADPRVAVEYNSEHEKAGSIRMYETIPYFSGRSTLEGVYNQASLQTHFVYYLASELGATSPNPFRSRDYSTFDTDNAIRHLRLFHVSHVVALSEQLKAALDRRDDVEPGPRIPPYAVYRLKDPGAGYVEPLTYAPVRSPFAGWRDKAYRWFTRKPQSPVPLVFTDDPQFTVMERDEWLEPPRVPLVEAGAVKVTETVTPEELKITTNRPGHPLLVKISWHPRWKAEGADGPYLVSPALMMIVPKQANVRLYYSRRGTDVAGRLLTLLGLVVVGALFWWSRRPAPVVAEPVVPAHDDTCGAPPPPRRWGAVIPVAMVVSLGAMRLLAKDPTPVKGTAQPLYEKASAAYAEQRWEDAAEFARHALARSEKTPLHAELLALRAESLKRAGRAGEAVVVYETLLRDDAKSPYVPQALFGMAEAHDTLGNHAAADAARDRIRNEFPQTPWAERLSGPRK